MEQIKGMVVDRCDLPEDFDINDYQFFQGNPTRVLKDNDAINIGDRFVQTVHTPGHSPGHMCFWKRDRGHLFTGDLVYKDALFAFFPSTDVNAYAVTPEAIEQVTGMVKSTMENSHMQ